MIRLSFWRRDDDCVDDGQHSFRPLYDHGGGRLNVYCGPSGPVVTVARILRNAESGRPSGEGLVPGALNDPNSP